MNHTYLLLLGSSLLAIAGQLFFKLGANAGHWMKIIQSPSLWVGLLCYGSSTVLWVYSLSKVRLGAAYAFTAVTFVGVYIASFVILREAVTVPKVLALLLIVSGFLMLTKWG